MVLPLCSLGLTDVSLADPAGSSTGQTVAAPDAATKEMDVGRYYWSKRDYAAAIYRFRTVVTQYPDAPSIPEALFRLTDSYLSIGLKSQAQTAAAVLARLYPAVHWSSDARNLLQDAGLEPVEDPNSWLSRKVK
ncbi:outer membrane protein assembly factor BamD [Bradyrhizobium sp. HKCCYLS20291]|uniref:outer membrane protein assembly factor BamD n=1 Tax=Bradyrhizobium sp. HKCCYLS20291 TaxID=3420766 RepID=UPI003EC11012